MSSQRQASNGLRYVNDGGPGINRRRRGRGFSYHDSTGRLIRDAATLARIRALAVPPAWTEVWICSSPRGHIQATGRDVRGRKQYRYHPLWRQLRDRAKFDRLLAFGEALPGLRRRVQRDLARPDIERRVVGAAVVRLLDATLSRVGNEEYARQNRSYGLTTLRKSHGRVRGSTLRFSFRGKGGRRHEISLHDPRLARVVRRCRDLPGRRLFQYLDEDGKPQAIDSDDINEYLREAAGDGFSARDFRTWAGSVLALRALRGEDASAAADGRDPVVRAVGQVARQLGNTPAVCRSAYIHPAVLAAHAQDRTPAPGGSSTAANRNGGAPRPARHGLSVDERELLAFLRRLHRRRAA